MTHETPFRILKSVPWRLRSVRISRWLTEEPTRRSRRRGQVAERTVGDFSHGCEPVRAIVDPVYPDVDRRVGFEGERRMAGKARAAIPQAVQAVRQAGGTGVRGGAEDVHGERNARGEGFPSPRRRSWQARPERFSAPDC